MPTGYTAGVADGTITDFRTFALRCARNFGACVLQRDEPMSVLPKPREVAPYYTQSLADAQDRCQLLARYTEADADREAEAVYQHALAAYRDRCAIQAETRNRYNAMLAEVMGWQPPTPEHNNLRQFMIDQLTKSRDYDCTPYGEAPTRLTGAAWLAEERAQAEQQCDRAAELLGDERQRCAGANAWIAALYASLPALVVTVEVPDDQC